MTCVEGRGGAVLMHVRPAECSNTGSGGDINHLRVEIKAYCFMGPYLTQEALSVILMKYDLRRLLHLLLFC